MTSPSFPTISIEDIASLCGTVYQLEPELWAQAKLLGDARISSNDGTRAVDQRRDAEETIDTCGALGELLLHELLLKLPYVELDHPVLVAMRLHFFNPSGGACVDEVDCLLAKGGIDSKTFCHDGKKSRFAINCAKHKSLKGVCSHYFCVFFKELGQKAYVAPLLDYSSVDIWNVVVDFESVGSLSGRSRECYELAKPTDKLIDHPGFKSPARVIHLWKKSGFRARYAVGLSKRELNSHGVHDAELIKRLSEDSEIRRLMRERFGLGF